MRKLILLVAVIAFGLAGVGAASAHVTVNPSTAVQGGFAKLSFRVPNERDAASTTKLEVSFPADAAVEFLSVKPTPGWTYSVVQAPVTTITWSGGKIGPGEFQEFDVSVGPLPKNKDSMVFKALQTYDNGEVVRWIDIPSGSGEPEHPAPVLSLTTPTSQPSPSPSAAASSDGTARALGGAGLVAGLAALALAVIKRNRAA